jgi:uncharacterized membrane protein YfcA
MNIDWLFILLALLSEILGTIGGFGSSLFFVPIASYFLDFHSVLGVTALFHICSNVSKIVLFKKGFNLKLIINIGIPAILTVVTGAFLSKFLPVKTLELFLAFFLIVISAIFLLFRNLTIKATAFNSIVGGTLSGFIAGLVGTGGAIRGLVLASFNLNIEVFITTSATIDLLIDSSRSIVYYLNGYIHQHDLYLLPILFFNAIVGTFIGKKILNHISQKRFKIIVLLLVLCTGIVTMLKFLF